MRSTFHPLAGAIAFVSMLVLAAAAGAQNTAQGSAQDADQPAAVRNTAQSDAAPNAAQPADPPGGALDGSRPRIVVSSDIGGTDDDDFQSMVHLFLYADAIDLEGIVASPYGRGRKADILRVIDAYERDYPNLKTWSSGYPTPDALRAISKQGGLDGAGDSGVTSPTEGSRWIVECAHRPDPRPLHVLVWGGIDDLAQALHDDPTILPKIRVHWVAGPNKKWSCDAYNYVITQHPDLWMIEDNSTYCGWFLGGDQAGDLGNKAFVDAHIRGRGALGDLFGSLKYDSVKMGDTPTLTRLLRGNPDDPTAPSWGGSFRPVQSRWMMRLDRLPRADDQIQLYGILEIDLQAADCGEMPPGEPAFRVRIDNQSLPGYRIAPGRYRVRFMPKSVKTWNYSVVNSRVPELAGQSGSFVSVPETDTPPADLRYPRTLTHWFADRLDPELAQGPVSGARTVNRWRADYLRDFAVRMEYAAAPRGAGANP